jgi:hypothetical protein
VGISNEPVRFAVRLGADSLNFVVLPWLQRFAVWSDAQYSTHELCGGAYDFGARRLRLRPLVGEPPRGLAWKVEQAEPVFFEKMVAARLDRLTDAILESQARRLGLTEGEG